MALDSEQRMEQIEGRVDRIEEALGSLTAQVAGDGTALAPGVVGVLTKAVDDQEDQHRRIGLIERTLDRVRWTVAGGAAVGGALGGGLVYLIGEMLRGSGS